VKVHQDGKSTKDRRRVKGDSAKIGLGIGVLLGLGIMFALVAGPSGNVTSPYGKGARQKQEMPAVPQVR